MALDKVSYQKLEDGTIQKTVTHTEIINPEMFEFEKVCVQAQLDAFAVGRSSKQETQDDIDKTISLYQNGLDILRS